MPGLPPGAGKAGRQGVSWKLRRGQLCPHLDFHPETQVLDFRLDKNYSVIQLHALRASRVILLGVGSICPTAKGRPKGEDVGVRGTCPTGCQRRPQGICVRWGKELAPSPWQVGDAEAGCAGARGQRRAGQVRESRGARSGRVGKGWLCGCVFAQVRTCLGHLCMTVCPPPIHCFVCQALGCCWDLRGGFSA